MGQRICLPLASEHRLLEVAAPKVGQAADIDIDIDISTHGMPIFQSKYLVRTSCCTFGLLLDSKQDKTSSLCE